MLLFDGFSCSVAEIAAAFWSLSADWPMSCVPSLPHLQESPDCVWSADWPVRFALPAVASDDAVFSCVTEPPSPSLRTRTGTFSFDAPSWAVSPTAIASCSFSACWPITCSPEPSCVWPAVCSVAFRFPAVAFEVASLVCETSPSSPSLSTRTDVLLFVGCSCAVPAAAPASWSLPASWPASWTTGGLAVAVPTPVTSRRRTPTASARQRRFIRFSLRAVGWLRGAVPSPAGRVETASSSAWVLDGRRVRARRPQLPRGPEAPPQPRGGENDETCQRGESEEERARDDSTRTRGSQRLAGLPALERELLPVAFHAPSLR